MSDFLQTLKLRSRLFEVSSRVPKEALVQEVNMVLDGQLGALLVRLNSLKALTAKNMASLEELKEGERYVKATLTKLAAEASTDQLTVQDMNFFNRLVFMRHRKDEQPEPKPQPDVLVQTARTGSKQLSTKDCGAGPFHLLKAFDDMYNNKDARLEQLIESKASLQPLKTKVMRRSQNRNSMLATYNSRNLPNTAPNQDHTDFDEPSGSRHQDYDSKLSDSNPTPLVSGYSHIESMRQRQEDSRSTAGTDPQQVILDYHNELLEVGNRILAISEEEIELDGIRKKKTKTEILKEVHFVQKFKAEILSKLHILKEFIMSMRSKRDGISNEVLFERLARLSKPKKSSAQPEPEPEEEPKHEGKFLSEELRKEFIERNYDKFLKKYNDRMRFIEDDLEKKRQEEEEALKRRANLPEISPETEILKLTASMQSRKRENEDHLKQLKEEASKKHLLKESLKPSSSSLNLSSPHKRSKSDYEQVKSKIDSWSKPSPATDSRKKNEGSVGTSVKTIGSSKDVKKLVKSVIIPEPFDKLPKTKKETQLSALAGERKPQPETKPKVNSDHKKPAAMEFKPPAQHSARELKKQPVVAVHSSQATRETLTEKKPSQKPKPATSRELESPTIKKAKPVSASDSKQQSEAGTPQLRKSVRSSQKKIAVDPEALPPVELPATCFVTPVKEEACPPPVAPGPSQPNPEELPDAPPLSPRTTAIDCGFFGFVAKGSARPSLNPSKVHSVHAPANLSLYETIGQATMRPIELVEAEEAPASIDEAKRRMSIYNSIAQINKSISSINHHTSHIEKSLSRQSSQGQLVQGQEKNEEDFLVFEEEDSFDPNKMLVEPRKDDKSLSLEGEKSFEKPVEPEPKLRGSLCFSRAASQQHIRQKHRSRRPRKEDVSKESVGGEGGSHRRRPDPRARRLGRVRFRRAGE